MPASSAGLCALYGALAVVYLGLTADFYVTYALSSDVSVLRDQQMSNSDRDSERSSSVVVSDVVGPEVSRFLRSSYRQGRNAASRARGSCGAGRSAAGSGECNRTAMCTVWSFSPEAPTGVRRGA
ncbi:uncharacterized protein LOC144147406 isoform X1 [Haemaphysalis longicornis]